MNHPRLVTALTILAVALSSYSLTADVRADQKTRVEFGGALGKIINIFGGKAAREGVTSTVAVQADRKATLNDTTGQIIDLREEKIYDLDLKKKTYKVTTFAELRRRMEEARQKAAENASKEQGKAQPEPAKSDKQMEVDFDVKNTGQKKTINSFDTHEVVMTIAVREKGKKLEESGGLVLTSDMWLTPKIAAMKEIADFDLRYARQLYGSMIEGVSADQMAAVMALYPMMKDAMAKMAAEGVKMDGTAVLTTTTADGVKSADQMAEEAKQNQDEAKPSVSGGIGGAIGGFARRAVKKKVEGDAQQRATFFTGTHEVLKVTTEVAAADVAVPAGFKEAK